MERPNKGVSLIEFPDEYVCIDTETTGLSCEYDDIIEVSAAHIVNGSVVESFSSLINPGRRIPAFITQLTGITNEMLESAAGPDIVLPELSAFIGSHLLVGHNVSFDINFLYDALQRLNQTLDNDFIDTMRVARKLYPEMKHHRLSDLVARTGTTHNQAHRAENDVKATVDCFETMKAEIQNGIGFDAFKASFKRKARKRDLLSQINFDADEIDETNPIFGKVVVFTGALSSMQRKDALQIVANLGGVPADSVTKKTNILVVGNEDFVSSVKDGKTGKMRKAEDLELKGHDIITISETTFLDLIQ